MTRLAKDSPFYPVAARQLILEGRGCLAFLDQFPVSEGHVLVVPHDPVLSLYELDEQVQAEIWDTVRRVREILEERFNPAGFNIGVNDGRAAGQTIPHAHVHVIPRYEGDVADPRGGIRWVIPGKAKYWSEDVPDSTAEVIGIDVGVAKGVHVVALRLTGTGTAGTFEVLGDGIRPEDAVALCLERRPACVGIDSPPAWPQSGTARQAEVQLRRLGIQLYATPSDPDKQKRPFYEWMKVGFSLFRGLAPLYPLYRQGPLARHALEVFPHATAVVLAGRHRPEAVAKAMWRERVLGAQGYDVKDLLNPDQIDAALAAVTAAYALRGSFTAFGDPTEGVIVTPLVDAEKRFAAARGMRADERGE